MRELTRPPRAVVGYYTRIADALAQFLLRNFALSHTTHNTPPHHTPQPASQPASAPMASHGSLRGSGGGGGGTGDGGDPEPELMTIVVSGYDSCECVMWECVGDALGCGEILKDGWHIFLHVNRSTQPS